MYFHSTFSRQKLLVFSFHEGIFSCSRQVLLLLLGFFFYFCGHTIWHTSIIESIQDVEHNFFFVKLLQAGHVIQHKYTTTSDGSGIK